LVIIVNKSTTDEKAIVKQVTTVQIKIILTDKKIGKGEIIQVVFAPCKKSSELLL